MTLKFTTGITDYFITFDIPNATSSGTWKLDLSSQASNTLWKSYDLSLQETNRRYTEFTFSIDNDTTLEHINGIYNYIVYNTVDQTAQYTGLMKVVSGIGGTTGTTAYVSNNDDREAVVYFRPNY
jgi:hypothetical protein